MIRFCLSLLTVCGQIYLVLSLLYLGLRLFGLAKIFLEMLFFLWLAINQKLNTQDKVAVWNKVDDLKCPLCSSVMDNHNHLFFDCDYSFKVWRFFKDSMRFRDAPDNIFAIIDFMTSRPIGKSI